MLYTAGVREVAKIRSGFGCLDYFSERASAVAIHHRRGLYNERLSQRHRQVLVVEQQQQLQLACKMICLTIVEEAAADRNNLNRIGRFCGQFLFQQKIDIVPDELLQLRALLDMLAELLKHEHPRLLAELVEVDGGLQHRQHGKLTA